MKTLGLTIAVVASLLTAGAGFAQAASSLQSSQQYQYNSHNDQPGNGSPNKVDGGR